MSELTLFDGGEDHVGDDTEDQSGSDGSNGDDLAYRAVIGDSVRDLDGKATDTGDQNSGYNEQVVIVVEVKVLEHLETADGDKAVESQANAAHDAARDSLEQAHDRGKEGQNDTHTGGHPNGYDGRVLGDGYAADRFAVGGVRADTEYGTDHGADAVTEKGAGQSGLFADKVLTDDGTEVLVVGDMFGEDDECNGQEGNGNFGNARSGQGRTFFNGADQSKAGIGQEGLDGHVGEVIDEGLPVDDHKVFALSGHTDQGEDGRDEVARGNTEDKRDQFHHLESLLSGEDNNGEESDQTAEKTDQVISAVDSIGRSLNDISHSASGKRKTDDGNGRSDNDGRHQLGDPTGPNEFDDDGKHDVNAAGKERTDDDTEVSVSEGYAKRTQKSERATQENRALAFGKEQVHDGTDTCAEKSGRDLHGQTDDGRHSDGRSHDGKELLETENKDFRQRRTILYVID